METGVAVLGHYEEEAFDQHNHPHEHTNFDGGLGESVSFGRFAVDSLSWVKRSSFNHNQYLEEVGSCSTPGSVRQKKAYFEAYYKAIAKRKALENAIAEETSNGDEMKGIDDTGATQGVPTFESNSGIGSTDTCMTDDARVWKEHVSAGLLGEIETRQTPIQQNLQDAGVSTSAKQDTISEEIQDSRELSNQKLTSGGAPESQHMPSLEFPERDESMQNVLTENHQDGFVLHGDELRLEECDNTTLASFNDMQDVSTETDGICLDDVTPVSKGIVPVDERPDAQVVDKFEMSNSSRQQAYKSSLDKKIATLSSAPTNDVNTRGLSKQTPLQSASLVRKAKMTSTMMLSTSAKPSKGSGLTGQGHRGVMEMKRLLNTGNAHTNVTVPQPFALAINKRAAATSTPQEQGGTKFSEKSSRNGSSMQSSILNKVQEKKLSGCRPVMDENRKREKPEHLPPSELRHGVNTKGLKKQEITDAKEPNQVDMRLNGRTEPVQTETGRKSRPSPARSNTNTFSFKCHERAEKRREKIATLSSVPTNDVNTKGLSKQTPSQSASHGRKAKMTSTMMPGTSAKPSKGSGLKGQGHGGVMEMKRLLNTGNAHTNVTVPQPFALATNKRAAATSTPQEQGGTKFSDKSSRNGSSMQSSTLKKVQEKKLSGCRPVIDENRKREKPEHLPPSELKRSVNTKGLKKQEITGAESS